MPQHLPLVAHSLAQWSKLGPQGRDTERLLRDWREQHSPSLDVTQALAHIRNATMYVQRALQAAALCEGVLGVSMGLAG